MKIPNFPDATGRVLSIALVGGHDKLDLVTWQQNVAVLDLGHMEEELLALVYLESEETKVALHGLDKGPLLGTGRLNVDGKAGLGRANLEGHRVVGLEQLLLVRQAGNSELEATW